MPARWVLLRFSGRLLWAALYAAMFVWPTGAFQAHPTQRLAALALVIAGVALAVVEVHARVFLEQDGVVIVRGLRRTRIAWADVRQVRARDGRLGPGWVELVRISSRHVVRLPVDVQQYPQLLERWAAAAAGGGAQRTQ